MRRVEVTERDQITSGEYSERQQRTEPWETYRFKEKGRKKEQERKLRAPGAWVQWNVVT